MSKISVQTGCILLLLSLSFSSQSQHSSYLGYDVKTHGQVRGEAFFINAFFGALVGGTGALLHKKDGEKWHRVFFKGFGQGFVGGSANYLAKDLTFQINRKNSIEYAWLAKLSNAAGTSIIENAASNRNFWEAWHLNIGPFRFSADREQGYRPKARLMPGALAAMAAISFHGKLNIGYTIRTGTPVFVASDKKMIRGTPRDGANFGNSILVNNNAGDFHETFAHEYVHVFQYEELSGLNVFLNPSLDRLRIRSPWADRMLRWVYPDFHLIPLTLSYGLQYQNEPCYFKNWYEREAEAFSARRDILICQ